jgi:hypothetical protein
VVHGRILPSNKFKRKSANILSLSKLTKFRKNNEAEVSKGKFPCLEDERTKSIRKKPQSIVTVGYGKERGS